MGEMFRDGGFGMFPTMIFGLVMLAAAVRYAAKPEQRLVPLLVSLGLLTLSAGGLGFVTGIIVTMKAIAQMPPENHWIALIGLGESLNNLALALALVVLSSVAIVVGAWRLARAAANGAVATAR